MTAPAGPRYKNMNMRIILTIVLGAALALAAACGATPAEPPPAARPLSPLAQLGERIFEDTSLSASGRMACATCHDEAHAFTPANGLPVQLGGAGLDLPGTRQAPAIRYLALSGPFRFEADGTPAGGFFWDGRAASLADQAAGPFLNPVEMAMPSRAAVVERLAAAPYADALRALFGPAVFDDVDGAYTRMTLAIEAYEREDVAFAPYSSKYDAFLRGEARLSDQELRGLVLFNAPSKGNCAACHPSKGSPGGAPPLFTDFTYDALGVPRNPAIPANADPAHFDLGLCGRPELQHRRDLCGAFKVPSLRNVAQRKVFFHNARFTSLEEVLHFYVERDTNPERFYPPDGQGGVRKFDDLPPELHRNVNVSEPPYDRRPGQPPALDDAEIADVITFLKTLDDGFTP